MTDLQVKYLGLSLKNPFIVSSCGISSSVKGIVQCAKAGAGALVLKSLFEEQINHDIGSDYINETIEIHPEALDYINELGKVYGPHKYLDLIRAAKAETDIPIIASINCISSRWWTEYAQQIEQAGADALELNIALMPTDPQMNSQRIEELHYQIVKELRTKIRIPLTIKLTPYLSALPALTAKLISEGANGLVCFNRFHHPDIDTQTFALTTGYEFSHSSEKYLPLRWIAILNSLKQNPKTSHLYPKDFSLSASSGIHTGVDTFKMLLAGANVVQIASILYLKGLKHLQTMQEELRSCLESAQISCASEAIGRITETEGFQLKELQRLQYMQALNKHRHTDDL